MLHKKITVFLSIQTMSKNVYIWSSIKHYKNIFCFLVNSFSTTFNLTKLQWAHAWLYIKHQQSTFFSAFQLRHS